MNSFYSQEELSKLGLKKYGNNVFISKKASLYSPEKISIGNDVRIDDFCILSGDVALGDHVHISAGSKLYGGAGIEFGDYSGCSANCIIYSETDDFSGEWLVGSTVAAERRHIIGGKVNISDFVQLGANSIVLPKTNIATGVATGAFTFVNHDLDEWSLYVGIPCHKLKTRSKQMLKLIE